MLEANPIVFIKKGILLLPEALKIPVNNGFKKLNIIPNDTTIK